MTRQTLLGLSLFAVVLLLTAAPGRAQTGDPIMGEALYVGTAVFDQGGAPCLACHGIAGHALGRAAGASYGPDLSEFYANYGAEGVVSILQDPSVFDSMQAIYADRPLTESEIADLAAFFGRVSAGPPPDIGSDLALHVAIGTVLLLAVIGLFGWRRLQGVRRPLVERFGTGREG